MKFGLTLVMLACHYILRFAYRFYELNRGNYSTEQQTALDSLINIAETVEALIAPTVEL